MTKEITAHGAFTNLVENTFSRHEDAIVALVQKKRKGYKPVTRAFITGHSLAGGMANVAHLFVKAGAKKADSPWAELAGKVTWLACTFASPVSIVRLYGSDNIPPLIVDLDASSYNVVYGCDAVPRITFLKYVGALLEIAGPEILKTKVEGNPSGWWEESKAKAKWVGVKGVIDAAMGGLGGIFNDSGVDTAADGAVKFLKKTGLAELARQYSQIGTIVLITDKDLECVHLKDAAIKETLDVGGEAGSVGGDAFETLLGGKPAEYFSNLKYAHSASYSTLMYK